MELRDITIGESIVERANKTPEGVFIKCAESIFTWKCVNNVTHKAAAIFTEYGIRQGDRVGIYGTNSVSWVFTFLTLQKIGATTVLINSYYKEKELLNCIEMADVDFLFYGFSSEGDSYETVLDKLRQKKVDLKFFGTPYGFRSHLTCLKDKLPRQLHHGVFLLVRKVGFEPTLFGF